jgi:hypothetical protein
MNKLNGGGKSLTSLTEDVIDFSFSDGFAAADFSSLMSDDFS